MYLIFDLDQTLINSSIAEAHRNRRDWRGANSLIPQMEVYDGIAEILAYVQQKGIKAAIVTSSPSNYCNRIVQHHQWLFPVVVCFHDTNRHKPNPDPILLAIEKLGNPPVSEIYSLGDTDTDIIASKRAGVKSVACLWGSNNASALSAAEPDLSFNSPHEVIEFLKKLDEL